MGLGGGGYQYTCMGEGLQLVCDFTRNATLSAIPFEHAQESGGGGYRARWASATATTR